MTVAIEQDRIDQFAACILELQFGGTRPPVRLSDGQKLVQDGLVHRKIDQTPAAEIRGSCAAEHLRERAVAPGDLPVRRRLEPTAHVLVEQLPVSGLACGERTRRAWVVDDWQKRGDHYAAAFCLERAGRVLRTERCAIPAGQHQGLAVRLLGPRQQLAQSLGGGGPQIRDDERFERCGRQGTW